MKKSVLVVLMFILVINVIGFVYAESNISCTDSDGGINYYVSGETCLDGTCINDVCTKDIPNNANDNNTLIEYSCKGNLQNTHFLCPNGCSNGACNTKCNGIKMVWQNVNREDNYQFSNDTCDGYRCLQENSISPSCYNLSECKSNCAGDCINIQSAKTQCNNASDCETNGFSCVKSTQCDISNQEQAYDDCSGPEVICCNMPKKEAIQPNETTGPIEITNNTGAICNGCVLDTKCYPFGFRKDATYCDDASSSFINQKISDSICNNNFECDSNLCVSGKCVSGNLLQKILSWFKNLFGGK